MTPEQQIEILLAKIQALRAVAYYDGQKFPWEHPELIKVGEDRKDYLEFIDPDDLSDEEYETLYAEEETE